MLQFCMCEFTEWKQFQKSQEKKLNQSTNK